MSPLKDLSIFVATPEQIIVSRKRTHAQWGKDWTLDHYLARDARLDGFEQARDGKLKTWVLAPRSDPETLDFLCSCETYQREGLCTLPDSKDVIKCINYGIASVFTPVYSRRKGYAAHMMRLLHWCLAPTSTLDDSHFPKEWGSPPPRPDSISAMAFSALYSDIGEAFFSTCGPTPRDIGWQVASPIDINFDLKSLDTRLRDITTALHFEWLYEAEAVQTWEEDSQQMIKDLSKEASLAYRICVLPRGGVAGYLNRRVTEVAPSGFPDQKIIWGVRLKESVESLCFATWAPDPQAPTSTTITITRLRADIRTFPIILKALCQYARSQDPQYERLEIWNLSQGLQEFATVLGGVSSRRTEHLDALCVYGMNRDNVQWLFNERYCWC